MQQSREIELKLEMPPAAASDVMALLGSNGRSKRLYATYYDTPDGALAEAGISFRVRRTGDTFVQTIKLDDSRNGALFNRSEWEKALPSDTPDLGAVDEAGLRDALEHEDSWAALQPAFAVDVERAIWDTEFDSSTAEIVFDRGSVLAGGAQEAVSEVELELKDGPAEALFHLARWIAGGVPARLGVLTKAERGRRLLAGKAGYATKAEPVALRADASTAQAFAVIVEACLRHFRLNEPLIARRDPSGLHQARVALRRLRTAISLFRNVVADERRDTVRTALRDLAATLGEARNLDVLIERIGDDKRLLEKLRPEREAAYDRAIAKLEASAARLLMLTVLEWAELGTWRRLPSPAAKAVVASPVGEFAAGTLDSYRRRVKKRGAGLADRSAEERHQLRIEAKKLRYAAEFFSGLYDGKKARRRAKSFLSALESLQSSLGALNDIATAQEMAEDLAAKGIALPRVGDEDEGELLRKAEAAYDDLVDAKPFWR